MRSFAEPVLCAALLFGCFGFLIGPGVPAPGDGAPSAAPSARFEIPLPEGEGPLLVLSGNETGFIRPCGCSKPALGGIHRRASVINALRERGQAPIVLSGGKLVVGEVRQQQIKLEHFLLALSEMGARALAPGHSELRLGAEFLAQAQEMASFPLVATNVKAAPGGPKLVPQVRLDEGFLVLGLVAPRKEEVPGFEIAPWEGALMEAAAALADKERLIVFFDGPVAALGDLAALLPEGAAARTLLVAPGDDPLFTAAPGSAHQLHLGSKGRHLHFYRAGVKAPFREMVLKESLPKDPAMDDLLTGYRMAVREEGLMASTPRRPQPLRYLGDASCVDCHEATCVTLDKSRHEHAYATLQRSGDEEDPECMACHVTGWRFESARLEAWGESTGFRSLAETPELINVTCESCHGPGQKHVEEGELMPRSKPKRTFCATCHDANNSPKFSFEKYWPKIQHPPKDD